MIKKKPLKDALLDNLKKNSLNNVCLGVNGPEFNGNDVDLVLVSEKLDFTKIRAFRKDMEEIFNKRVSIIPMTELQVADQSAWSLKFATMVYKGIDWVSWTVSAKIPLITLRKLKALAKKEAPFFISLWQKKLANEEPSQSKALELFIQEMTLLTS